MSKSQKILRVISIILIVLSVLSIAASIATMVLDAGSQTISHGNFDFSTETLDDEAADEFLAVVAMIGGTIDFLLGFFGLRASRDASKTIPCIVFAVICLLYEVVNLGFAVGSTINGGFDPYDLFDTAFSVAVLGGYLFLAMRIKGKYDEEVM